jgi:nitrile hydratase
MTADGHHHHDHHPIEDGATPAAVRAGVLRDLLIEAGVFRPEDLHRTVDLVASRTPRQGAGVVARAWVDAAFRARLMADANAAVAECGIDLGGAHLHVVANEPTVHNLVVCTLCSCYPKTLLGLPPAWYKSRNYRSRAVYEPRAVLREFGVDLDEDVTVRVHDSTADLRYLVLPMRPAGTEGLDEAELAALVTRDSMIGTALPGSRHG